MPVRRHAAGDNFRFHGSPQRPRRHAGSKDPCMVPNELEIDPALWQGDSLEQQLQGHFADLGTLDTFKRFMTGRHDRDHSAKLNSSRRIYNREGGYVLVLEVTWRDERRRWMFPMTAWLTAPDTGRRYFVFDARLKKIGLDIGIALWDEIYMLLPGIDVEKPA
jgi:hypothetical protein